MVIEPLYQRGMFREQITTPPDADPFIEQLQTGYAQTLYSETYLRF